jgi:hypothetical protein
VQDLDLVYCYEGRAWEEEWWLTMLADFNVRVHRSSDFSLFIPGAVYMVTGSHGLGHLPQAFLERIRNAGNCGLIHLGDEFSRGPYEVYASFAYVIRQHFKFFVKSPGIVYSPVGYSNGSTTDEFVPASAREFAWAFTGADGATRRKVARAWAGFEPNYVHLVDLRAGQKHQSREDFLRLLRNSVFVPCPMGNVHLESLRIYEAIENGAIPIVSRRTGFPYWEALFGPNHRLPAFKTWGEALAFAQDLYSRPNDLDQFQSEIRTWWESEKRAIRERVRMHVIHGRTGAFSAHLKRDFAHHHGLGYQAVRIAETIRHHDLTALAGRADVFLRRVTGRLAWR